MSIFNTIFRKKTNVKKTEDPKIIYRYTGEGTIEKEINGKSFETTMVYSKYDLYDQTMYFAWIDDIVSREDEVVEMHIGCKRMDSQTIDPVFDDYKKSIMILEIQKKMRGEEK